MYNLSKIEKLSAELNLELRYHEEEENDAIRDEKHNLAANMNRVEESLIKIRKEKGHTAAYVREWAFYNLENKLPEEYSSIHILARYNSFFYLRIPNLLLNIPYYPYDLNHVNFAEKIAEEIESEISEIDSLLQIKKYKIQGALEIKVAVSNRIFNEDIDAVMNIFFDAVIDVLRRNVVLMQQNTAL